MGEAKRRKQHDPKYGRAKTAPETESTLMNDLLQVSPRVNGETILMQSRNSSGDRTGIDPETLINVGSLEDLKKLSKGLVPQTLAYRLAVQIDGELLCPPENGVFPKSWLYQMRCLENSTIAMQWVSQTFSTLNLELSSQEGCRAYTNVVKVLALAVLSIDPHP
ncbi:MAG: hypothetical protein MUC48_09415 [Leptolyngbya sp. Prado105]|jgi:hypothetical protein|nr:hypothetical protein [Leptolyngbya sp. Prado105]